MSDKTGGGVNELDEALHKFAGCSYPHPNYLSCEWCDHIPEVKAIVQRLITQSSKQGELYGRLHEVIEGFQAGQASADYYSKRHETITDSLSSLQQQTNGGRDDG